jgi:hypothetical protein
MEFVRHSAWPPWIRGRCSNAQPWLRVVRTVSRAQETRNKFRRIYPDGQDSSRRSTDSRKDEDEYAHDRRLGLITDTEHTAVQAARDEAVAMIQARNGMFAASPEERWLPDPAWAMPSLP